MAYIRCFEECAVIDVYLVCEGLKSVLMACGDILMCGVASYD